MTAPSSSNDDTPRSLTGQFLLFVGPLVTMGGALAILRTGQRSIFYVVLMPIGLAMWAVGLWLRLGFSRR